MSQFGTFGRGQWTRKMPNTQLDLAHRSLSLSLSHTHTHRQRQRERERERATSSARAVSQGEARVDSTFFAVEDLAIGEANPQIYTAPSMLLILPYRSLFGTLSFMRRLRPSRYFHSKTRCTSISRLQSGKRPHGLKVCPKTPAYRFQYG